MSLEINRNTVNCIILCPNPPDKSHFPGNLCLPYAELEKLAQAGKIRPAFSNLRVLSGETMVQYPQAGRGPGATDERSVSLELFEWMTSTLWGESLMTLLVSMVPVIELRGGVPFGTALGLAPLHALAVCIIGNMIPIPFIIVYIRRIFQWMRRKSPRLNGLVDRLERKAHLKGRTVTKYKYLGLCIFVAIPLPGTGAWTGALIAALLDMPLRKAVPSIFLGVVIAGLIMTLATGTVVAVFSF